MCRPGGDKVAASVPSQSYSLLLAASDHGGARRRGRQRTLQHTCAPRCQLRSGLGLLPRARPGDLSLVSAASDRACLSVFNVDLTDAARTENALKVIESVFDPLGHA